MITDQLRDHDAEVTNNALRCIGRLMKKVPKEQITKVAQIVIELLVNEPESQQNPDRNNQDMFSCCMKQIIKEVPDQNVGSLDSVFPTALDGIKKRLSSLGSKDTNAKRLKVLQSNLEELIEVSYELFKRSIDKENPKREELAQILVQQILKSKEQSLQKRCSQCLGELAVTLKEAKLVETLATILTECKKFQGKKERESKEQLLQLLKGFSAVIVRVTHKIQQKLIQEYVTLFQSWI